MGYNTVMLGEFSPFKEYIVTSTWQKGMVMTPDTATAFQDISALINLSPDLFCALDKDGRIVISNPPPFDADAIVGPVESHLVEDVDAANSGPVHQDRHVVERLERAAEQKLRLVHRLEVLGTGDTELVVQRKR